MYSGKEGYTMPKKPVNTKEQPKKQENSVSSPSKDKTIFDEVWDEVFNDEKKKEEKKPAPVNEQKKSASKVSDEVQKIWDDYTIDNFDFSKYEEEKSAYDKMTKQIQQIKANERNATKQKNTIDNKRKIMKDKGYSDKEIAAEVKKMTQKIVLGFNTDTFWLINDCYKNTVTNYAELKPQPEHKPIFDGIINSFNDVKNQYNKLLEVEKERTKLKQSGKDVGMKKKVELEQKYKKVFFDLKRSTKFAADAMQEFVGMDINRPHDPKHSTPEMDDERAFISSVTEYVNVVRGFSASREKKVKREREERMKDLSPKAKEAQRYLEAQDAIYSTAQELSDGLLTFRGKPQYAQVCKSVSKVAKTYNAMIEAEKKYGENKNDKTRSEYEKALKAMQAQVNEAKAAAAVYNEYKKGTGNWGAHAGKNARKRINAVARVELLAENVTALISPKLKELEKKNKELNMKRPSALSLKDG